MSFTTVVAEGRLIKKNTHTQSFFPSLHWEFYLIVSMNNQYLLASRLKKKKDFNLTED
jgi:hypothetical protein